MDADFPAKVARSPAARTSSSASSSCSCLLARHRQWIYFARPRAILTRSASEARNLFPRLRFGLVWIVLFQAARSIMLIALRCCSSDSATSSCQSSFCRSPSFYGPERGAHNSRNVRIFSSGFWQRLYDATCVLARRFSFPFKVLNRTYSWTRGVLQHFAIVMDKYGIYSTSQVPKRGEKPIVGQRRLLRPNLPAERRPPATRRRARRGRPRSHGAGGGFPLGTPDQEWPTMPVLAHSGHSSFWWMNVTRGMEDPVFPENS